MLRIGLTIGLLVVAGGAVAEAGDRLFRDADVFDLEYALDPQVSPDGTQVAYVRQSMDVMTDRALQNVWIVDANGANHRPLLSGAASYSSPRWSPSGRSCRRRARPWPQPC